MAAMLSASRYTPHFEITGTRTHHVGAYDFARAQEALALKRAKAQVGLQELEEANREASASSRSTSACTTRTCCAARPPSPPCR